MKLTEFKVLSFDCYGTLIDWERGMTNGLAPLIGRMKAAPDIDRLLEHHARLEAAQQALTPTKLYRDVLAVVYKRLAEEHGLSVPWRECVEYGLGARNWPAFQDSAGVLQYLKKHFKLVVLSNTDNDTFSHSNDKLQVDFDAIYTAQDIGSYKPSLQSFEYMLARQKAAGVEKHEILHVAESLFHDHEPANRIGIASCWIYRRFDKPGYGAAPEPLAMPSYNFQFNSLADFAKAHQEALRA
ncbi:haloacid dehalogenase type II [Bordetella genomosp. 7]|uniref:Haloacid dehalogenase, type II n=1 Tax=Bordetella genomosp. 7 TaxID=1416805 RepID=A0A261QWJ4_9BORD|nr:haloacid dehalogenase type II [Bordetella genomosp. 7]OZI17091.1 haloacid dehalogenase, type II [Bordetella genomosp. 7]